MKSHKPRTWAPLDPFHLETMTFRQVAEHVSSRCLVMRRQTWIAARATTTSQATAAGSSGACSTHRIGRIPCCGDGALWGGPVRSVHSFVVHLHKWRNASHTSVSNWLVPFAGTDFACRQVLTQRI